MEHTAFDLDDSPEGLGFSDRMWYLDDVLRRGDLSMVDRFSPEELWLVFTRAGQCDQELTRYVSICQEAGATFLHPEDDDDDAFLARAFATIFPSEALDHEEM